LRASFALIDALTETLQAIRTNRSLLDDPDPTATLLQAVSSALPTRCDQALAAAIKAAEPEARRVSLPGATIHDGTELDDWLAEARAKIETALEQGPVIL
jgi:hypothetical protein